LEEREKESTSKSSKQPAASVPAVVRRAIEQNNKRLVSLKYSFLMFKILVFDVVLRLRELKDLFFFEKSDLSVLV
jgi:hypothetical protein